MVPDLPVQARIQVQAVRLGQMESTAEEMRRQLIEDRYKTLDTLARRKGWARRAPREGTRYYGQYQEWKYLVKKKEKLKAPKREVIRKAPKHLPKPMHRPLPKAYKPDWVAK